MHILVVNDDGPPSAHASPYVHSLVQQLQRAGHRVSVCLPHTQRSWIGKAHMIGQMVTPTYYRPPENQLGGLGGEGTYHEAPWPHGDDGVSAADKAASPPQEWVLVNGTPASCVQIGLHHVFGARGPIDLVVSGPNYGRNTTAVFALSSGTLGGALEAAASGVKAVAVSYAFFRRAGAKTVEHDHAVIEEASQHTVRVVEALVRQWPADGSVDLYSVNVPLVADVAKHKTVWAPVLQNYWRGGACFVEVDEAAEPTEEANEAEGEEEEEKLRKREREGEGEAAGSTDKNISHTSTQAAATTPISAEMLTHKRFKWQPRFDDVFRSVDEAPPGNDGWAVREGFTSISPLKANFCQAATELHGTEFQL